MIDISGTLEQVPSTDFPLRIALLGSPEITWRRRPITLARRQLRALFYRIAVSPQPVPRDHLCFLLWPDCSESVARRNLTVLLNQLRRALPEPDLVFAADDWLAIDRGAHWSDLSAFAAARRHPDTGLLTSAVDLYRGPLLHGFALPASIEFEEWIAQERRVWEQRYLAALTTLVDLHTERRDYAGAIPFARRVLETDELAEAMHQRLIALYAAAGDRTGALRQFEACVAVLDRELAIDPLPETRAIYEAVRDGQNPLGENPNSMRGTETSVRAHTISQARANSGAAATTSRLPAPPNPLLGRAEVLADACELLLRQEVRLLTLCGTGGSGKTRLALEVAWNLHDSFADGVVFVALAPLRDPDLVLDAIAQACGVQQAGATPLISLLRTHLQNKQMLLVLDNCEHLLAAAPLIADLLASAPGLSVLATSRSVLNLRGEQVFTVLPLPLPDLTALPPLGELAAHPAVALTLARTRAHAPAFQLTEGNAAAVAAICAQLEGLPLALELAAARLKILSPAALLERLDRRLVLLAHGARDLPERHQTLRATIAWSYQLLDQPTRRLFEQFAVFAGGWTLPPAVEAICGGDEHQVDLLQGIQALCDAHLIMRGGDFDVTPRFNMLETIREYALEQLQARGARAAGAERHAVYYCSLVEQAAQHLQGSEQQIWFQRLAEEYGNVRAALHWAHATNHRVMLARMAGALHHYWYVGGMLGEGRHWMELALADPLGIPPRVLALAYNGAGILALRQADYEYATRAQQAAYAFYRQADDGTGMAQASIDLGLVALHTCRFDEAQAHFDHALALEQTYGLHVHSVFTRCWAAGPALYRGDYRPAELALEQALTIARAIDDTWSTVICLLGLGQTQLVAGDYRRAQQLFTEACELVQPLDARESIAWALEGQAAAAVGQHDPHEAARMFGAAETLRREIGAPMPPHVSRFYAPYIAAARAHSGAASADTAWQAANKPTPEQLITRATTDST